MTETETKTDAIAASLLPDITDDEIKTALCYVDAKTQCTENKELNFSDVFAESWAEMTADEADDAETDDPDHITLATICQWFRQGFVFVNPHLNVTPVRTTETIVPLGDLL